MSERRFSKFRYTVQQDKVKQIVHRDTEKLPAVLEGPASHWLPSCWRRIGFLILATQVQLPRDLLQRTQATGVTTWGETQVVLLEHLLIIPLLGKGASRRPTKVEVSGRVGRFGGVLPPTAVIVRRRVFRVRLVVPHRTQRRRVEVFVVGRRLWGR